MLILAGVSLNAIVGDNGILTNAQKAKVASEKANIMEQIETELSKYNIDTIVDGDNTPAITAISDLIKRGILDSSMASDGTFTTDKAKFATIPIMNEDGSWTGKFRYVVGKGQYAFSVYQNEDHTFTAEESDITAGDGATGGEVTGGTTLVTEDTFKINDDETTEDREKGKYTINGDAKVIFADELEGEYSIYVKSGSTATVSIFKNMTLSNTGVQRSAIDIEPGGILNLWIAEGATVTVDSGQGFGAQGEVAGIGGYAGIHVPQHDTTTTVNRIKLDSAGSPVMNEDGKYVYEKITLKEGTATLNLGGEGTIIARAGNSGNGFIGSGHQSGGGGARSRDWWKWTVMEVKLL